ncbi:hypothetical protein RR48_01143 [Papilio machaon]|uniref:Uncharacterized protein n=1 Tax=Papilio machaon TaxID=76193 RepID=A0A0N1PKB5_PAPMA|nr:hypothetical protein RR48_01143 [Papilio machaon]
MHVKVGIHYVREPLALRALVTALMVTGTRISIGTCIRASTNRLSSPLCSPNLPLPVAALNAERAPYALQVRKRIHHAELSQDRGEQEVREHSGYPALEFSVINIAFINNFLL